VFSAFMNFLSMSLTSYNIRLRSSPLGEEALNLL
jgi:hypothetical protein